MSSSDTERYPDPPEEKDTTAMQELFALAERSAHLASYVWYLPSGPIEWSEQIFHLLGMDPNQDKASVESFLSCIHPEDIGKMHRIFDEILSGSRKRGAEHYRLIRSNGEVREVISRWTVVRKEAGHPWCLYGTLLDVTDALRENERLARALHELARAQRLANVGSWYWNLRTGHIEWSEQLYRILGYDTDVTPSPEAWQSRLHPDDANHATNREANCSPPIVGSEFRIVQPTGDMRWVSHEVETSYDAEGRPVQMRGVVVDITERRLLEERLRESLRLEAVGQLAGGVAHDFNNLLAIVQANLDRLRVGWDSQHLDNIESAVRTATTLTQRLLAFSRQSLLRPQVMNLNETITNVLTLLRGMLGSRIQVQFLLGEDVPNVRLDEGQLHQVLINLITNARDAMPEGGTLTIQTRRATLSTTTSVIGPDGLPLPFGDYAILSVRDSGCGMDATTRARIFEPFFTTKATGQGTGLGLASVFGIVSQSGGGLEVETTLGSGSCFRLYFPATKEQAIARRLETTGAIEPAPPSSVRILLVEDNDLVREPITYLLQEAGYEVHVAANAMVARSLWEQHQGRFDVLMTDIVMPGDSGTSLARDLRQQRPDLRVLFMTGYVDGHAPQPDARTEVLQKPFRGNVPLDAIRRLLSR